MDWSSLLDDLWNYAASRPKELEAKIQSCLKGHSTESYPHIKQALPLAPRVKLTEVLAWNLRK